MLSGKILDVRTCPGRELWPGRPAGLRIRFALNQKGTSGSSSQACARPARVRDPALSERGVRFWHDPCPTVP